MDREAKSAIASMRRKDLGYKRIPTELGISRDSVASFCLRNGLSSKGGDLGICPQCGRAFALDPKHLGKRFCSDRCRAAWWNTNRERRHPENANRGTCLRCGREFAWYGGRERRYCSFPATARRGRKEATAVAAGDRRKPEIASYQASMAALNRLFEEGAINAAELMKAEAIAAKRHGLAYGSPFRRSDLISVGRKCVKVNRIM